MKKIGVVLKKPKFNTTMIFIKELKKKAKQKINYYKVKKLIVDTNYFAVKEGDVVEVQLTRPLSKTKNFIIKRILFAKENL